MLPQKPGGSSSSKSTGSAKSPTSRSGSPAVVELDDGGYQLVQTLMDEQASHLS